MKSTVKNIRRGGFYLPLIALLTFGQNTFAQQSLFGIRLQDASSHVLTINGPSGGFTSSYNFRFPVALPGLGSIFYTSDALGQTAWLAPGSNGQVLTLLGGVPTWANAGTLSGGVNNTIPIWTGTSSLGTSTITENSGTLSTTENLTLSGTKTLTLGTVSTNSGSLSLANASSANLTTLQAGSATAAVTYKLPPANGTNGQVIQTDGNNPAQLSWATSVTSGNAVQFNVTSAQSITNTNSNYLFNVTYTSAGNFNMLGAVINSTNSTGNGGALIKGLSIITGVHNGGLTEIGLDVSSDGNATNNYTGLFHGGNGAFTNAIASPTPTNVLEVTQSIAGNTNDALNVKDSGTAGGNAITANSLGTGTTVSASTTNSSSGKAGSFTINNATNTATALTTSSNGTGSAFSATMTGTGYAGVFTGGNVGIGTSTPTQLLHLKNGHIRSEQTTKPTIAVTTQNGITAAAISNGSTDTRGTITTTGTNSGGANTDLTITFHSSCSNTPVVIITPANATAQTATFYVTSTTTSFDIFFVDGANATPSFNYIVIE